MQTRSLDMLRSPPTPPTDSSRSSSPKDRRRLISSQPFQGIYYSPPEGLSQATIPVRLNAVTLQKELSRYASGIGSADFECFLAPTEFCQLREEINSLSLGNELRYAWYEKLKFEYDSEAEHFFLPMATPTRDTFAEVVSKHIEERLARIEAHSNSSVQAYIGAIQNMGSSKVIYDVTEDSDYTPSQHSTVTENETAMTSSPSKRQKSILPENSGRPACSSKEYEQGQDDIVSGTSQSNASDDATIIKHYSPGKSFIFTSSRITDGCPAFVIEVAKSERPEHLTNKVKGYFRYCQTRAILACHIGRKCDKAASVELWRSEIHDEDSQTMENVSVPYLEWRHDLLDIEGNVCKDLPPQAKVRLSDFISVKSFGCYFGSDDKGFEQFRTYDDVSIRLPYLAERLIKLRALEAHVEDYQKHARTRPAVDGWNHPAQKRKLSEFLKGGAISNA